MRSHPRPWSLGLLLTLSACLSPPAPEPQVEQQEIFTTLITLTLYDHAEPAVFTSVFDRLHEIDTLMSDYRPDSEISRVSAAAGQAPVRVSEATYHVVEQALAESALTHGVFDPSIGPVSHLWDVGQPHTSLPTPAQIAAARSLVNWRDVVLDPTARSIFLRKAGMRLDVGGIAKGYAMDEALALARKAGVQTGIFSMGNSSIGFLGTKPNGKPWKIGLQDPFKATGESFATIEGTGLTVETSGPYQKYFLLDGRRYHHIMDPRTGSPADSGLEQVTLLLPLDTKLSDGLSTSCFILGVKDGLALVESLPDAAAIFVTSDRQVYLSRRVGDRFTLGTDPSFVLHR